MFNPLSWLLGRCKPNPYKGFSVHHYPESGRFYPKAGWAFITKNDYNGLYERGNWDWPGYAEYGKTEAEAWRIIDLYREQRERVGVRITKRKPK